MLKYHSALSCGLETAIWIVNPDNMSCSAGPLDGPGRAESQGTPAYPAACMKPLHSVLPNPGASTGDSKFPPKNACTVCSVL